MSIFCHLLSTESRSTSTLLLRYLEVVRFPSSGQSKSFGIDKVYLQRALEKQGLFEQMSSLVVRVTLLIRSEASKKLIY